MEGVSECFDDSALAQLFAVAAEGADRDAVDAHVAECAACRRLVGTYARLFSEDVDGDDGSADDGERLHGIDLRLPSTGLLARAWADAQIGRTLSERWTLRRVIGLGGSAVVFEAEHKTGSRVAIKVLRPEHLSIAPMMGRFLREAYVANKVDHAGVVRVIDDGVTEEGAPFLVMDLLIGETLRERVERVGPLSGSAATDLGVAVLLVLERAHERGIIHRDLKPDNVFFDEEQRVRVLDFGIARMTVAGADLTETGLGMGTSAYMPPEQARGEWKAVGPATDLWALAATLMYALTKRPPHVAENAQQTLIAAATLPAPKIGTLAARLTPALAKVIDQALAFDPEDRPKDAETMRTALLAAQAAPMDPPDDRKRRFGALIGLALVVVPLAGVLLFVELREASTEQRVSPTSSALSLVRPDPTASVPTSPDPALPPSPSVVLSTGSDVPRPFATPPLRPNAGTTSSVAPTVSGAPSVTASATPPSPSGSTIAPAASASATPGEILRRRH